MAARKRQRCWPSWTSFRGVLWIAASLFGLSQVPLIMKNMIKDEEPGPVSPDPGL